MVGQALQRSASNFRGLRPVNPARDLTEITRLLEHAFRDELDWSMAWARVPILREVGTLLWAASFMPTFPNALAGFVWEEEGHVVGNVTVTPDELRPGLYMVSNVAVEENYRRRGIARSLMEATVEEVRTRQGGGVLLQVRPYNRGAIQLYEGMGFQTVDTLWRYAVLANALAPEAKSRPLPAGLRPLRASEGQAAYRLARSSLPPRLARLRPPRPGDFAQGWEDWLLDLLSGQQTWRWGYQEGDVLQGLLTVHGQRLGSPHSLQIYLAPEARGRPEGEMVSLALDKLASLPRRAIHTEVWSSHGELGAELERSGFHRVKGLTLMLKELAP